MPELTPAISLPEACHRLGITYAVGWRRLLSGELTGERRGSRWVVTLQSVENAEKAPTAVA